MKRNLPPYVYRKGRKGDLWFERRGWKSVRLLEEYPSPEFYAELARVQKGVTPVPTNKSLSNLIALYRRSDKFTTKAQRTKKDYDKVLTFLHDRMGHIDPTKLERPDILRLRDANADAVRFANYCVQMMKILMEFAIDLGWLKKGDQNPAKGVSELKSKSAPRQPWPADLVIAYRAAADERALLVFELLLGTGQRIGDVLAMKWGDLQGNEMRVVQNKTGKELWIPLTDRLRDLLARTPRRSVFILTNLNATGPWSYRGASQAVRKVRVAIGAEDYDIHSLRHTAAAELFAAGCSKEQVKAITGHESDASVLRYGAAAQQRIRAQEATKLRKD